MSDIVYIVRGVASWEISNGVDISYLLAGVFLSRRDAEERIKELESGERPLSVFFDDDDETEVISPDHVKWDVVMMGIDGNATLYFGGAAYYA